MKLNAHGRHSFVEEIRKNRPAFIDMGPPREGDAKARTWHFDAVRVPWANEMNL